MKFNLLSCKFQIISNLTSSHNKIEQNIEDNEVISPEVDGVQSADSESRKRKIEDIEGSYFSQNFCLYSIFANFWIVLDRLKKF